MSKTGYIYMLVCSDVNIKGTYVGSTRDERQRLRSHKSVCNNENDKNNQYVYQYIRQNGGWLNWSMIRLEQIQYNDRAELHARERHWIEQKHSELNKVIPTRTHQEYNETHKSEILEKSKEYYEEHKEQILEKSKEYYEEHKEHKLEKIKEYYEANKSEIKEKSKEYYETNKAKIKEQKSKPYTCECGRTLRTDKKSIHIKTKFHTNYLSSLSEAAVEVVAPISITS